MSVNQSAFDSLKKIITKVFIFAYYKQDIKIIIKIDLSDNVNNRIFSLLLDDKLLYSIVFFSKNLKST